MQNMKAITSRVQLLDNLEIVIFPEDLAATLKTGGNSAKIIEMAGNLLSKIQGNWRPRAIVRWLGVARATSEMVMLKPLDGGEPQCLSLGFAGSFMATARYGLVGVFTAGDELEKESLSASAGKRVMDAYLYDLIGLAVLEKTRRHINRIVEEQARELSWGVGPFLSPGSVHGWELADQDNLCSLVPVERIGVTRENGILKPFKTISCLVGIGPEFTAKTVGATCDVCAKKDRCDMRARE